MQDNIKRRMKKIFICMKVNEKFHIRWTGNASVIDKWAEARDCVTVCFAENLK